MGDISMSPSFFPIISSSGPFHVGGSHCVCLMRNERECTNIGMEALQGRQIQ